MAEKSSLGKVNNMGLGAVKYAIKRAEENGSIESKYGSSLKERLAQLKAM